MGDACATCGGTDHRRSSSSRCPLRKKRAREADGDDGGTLDTYTVKRGLRGFVCPLLGEEKTEKLLAEIRRDVRDLSSFAVDLSILVHHFYTSRLVRLDDDAEFLRLYPRFDGRALAAVLCGDDARKVKRTLTLSDPDGLLAAWKTLCRRSYDVKLRSFLVNHVVKRYATALETNVKTHAFARIKRAIVRDKPDADKKTVHEACYARFYAGSPASGCESVDAWFDSAVPEPPTADGLDRDFWRFVPLFRRLQVRFWAAAMGTDGRRGRGIRLFPQLRHGIKHLLYDSAALHELLRRTDRSDVPSTWKRFNESERPGGEAGSRVYWRRYFACPPKFGYSVRTDGVAVSLAMLRKGEEEKTVERPAKKRKPKTQVTTPLHLSPDRGYVAVDPGAREPIVTCREKGRLAFSRLTSGRVYFETGELWREKRRKKITAAVDEKVREDERRSEAAEGYSSKHGGDPRAYVEFRLEHFDSLQRAYENRKLARLRFEKYSRRQKFMSDVVREFFPDADETILYGAGCEFMNRAAIRGHRKFSHDTLLRELKRSGRTVLVVDESYTTKRCHRCFGASTVAVSPSPHRYVHCPVCRRGANRDRNGAANILLKSTGRWMNSDKTGQPPFPTTARTSRGDGTDSPPP